MMKQDFLPLLRTGMLVFWGVLYGVLAFTNACDVLHRYSPQSGLSRFRAQNRTEVEAAVATVQASPMLASWLFAMVIIGQTLGFVFFAAAVARVQAPASAHLALLWNVLIWQGFLVADNIFRTYHLTVVHTVLLCASLLTAVLFLL